MEALVAVGLATNIITFVDFAATLVKGAKEISLSGSLSGLDQVQGETAHLKRMIEPLKIDPDLPKELANLAQECIRLADETTATLAEIYAYGPRPSRLSSFKVAFRAMRKKGKLESLQKHLDSCRSLILTQITILVR